ncbi:kinesin-like protein KIF20B isoform X2 [Penaeus japonicus]|uniref:kinesin-like protein KIF20B isoform X2 n=1 Tax=Penaeus japonicus TaxID=27405 RepID=UPI001C70C7A9|nr:kinesin-like protein KIF20B isoform X2 [Penaeus japonicus]
MSRAIDRLSYLHATDYEFAPDLASTFDPCKNLNDVFQSIPIEEVDVENLKVYLRVRPSLPDEQEVNEDTQVDILDNHSIILTAPASSNTFKNSTNGITKLSQKFTFSHIYGPSTNQKELFNGSTLGLVKDFVNGQNCLLFTYGATNSGKTFTVQGTPNDAGILPRALEVLFNNVGEHQYQPNDLKPRYFCGVMRLEESDIRKEEEKKERIFKITSDLGSTFSQSTMSLSKISFGDCSLNTSDPSTVSDISRVSSVIDNRCQDDTALEVENSENTVYAVFVSFAEIYNEYIYDLLEKMPTCKKNKRNPLMLGEDRNSAIYIKGLQEVRVRSAEEAWKLLEIGRQNLHFAATKLNHNSSRSHCIFTIKLIRMADSQNPHVARVSMLSVCDLAGAERAGKTHGSHDRLKEAGNINSSLLVLSRCIEALRRNQIQKGTKKREIPVPYRDSKLTRLFQSFFLGRGKAAMIVNISKTPLLFDETLQVLKFSAIAKQVAISQAKERECQVKPPKRNSHFSKFIRQSFNSSGRLSVPWAKDEGEVTFGESEKEEEEVMETVKEEEEDDDERYEALVQLISSLKDELMKEHKEKVEMEERIREELCAEFSQQLVEIENSWSQRLKNQQARSEELTDWRINALMKSTKKINSRKRIRAEDDPDDEYVSSILLHQEERKVQEQATYIEELETEKKHMVDEVEALKISQKKTSELLTRSQEENSRLTFQLAQLTANFDKVNKELEAAQKLSMSITTENLVIEELKRRVDENKVLIASQDEEIKDLKEMLIECAEELIAKQQECTTLEKSLKVSEGTIAKQLVNINELESQVSEARSIVSQYAAQVEERDQHTAELREQLEASKKLSDKEHECNAAQKKKEEAVHQKEKIEEDYLRDKSKLLLELADLKRCGPQKTVASKESPEDLQIQIRITELEKQKEEVEREKDHLKNQLTESKDLFAHLQTANSNLESHFDTIQKENEKLKETVDELSCKLMSIQEERAEDQLDISSQKATTAEAISQVHDYQKQLKEKDEQIISLDHQIQDLERQIKSLEERSDDKDLQEEFERLQKSSDSLSVERDELQENIQKLTAEVTTQREEINNLKQSSVSKKDFMQVKEELANKLEEIEALQKEKEYQQKVLDDIKEKLEDTNNLMQTIEAEKLSSVENLRIDVSDKNSKIEELEREIELMKSETENEMKYMSQVQELETQLKDEKLKIEELEKEAQIKSSKIEEQDSEIGKLRAAVQVQDEENKTFLEKVQTDLDDLKKEKERLQETLTSHQKETDRAIEQINLEKTELTGEISRLKMALQEIEGCKSALELQLSELPELQERENALKIRLEDMEQVKILNENKMLEQEDSAVYKEKLGEQEQLVASLSKGNDELKMKLSEMEGFNKTLNEHLKEKEEVIAALNAKVESLDYKLTQAEEELEAKKQEVSQSLNAARERYDILEKEVRAVREARQEEVSQYRTQKDVQEQQLQQKDEEIKSLQQEIKKLLQQSISSISNTSQITIPETPKVKKESVEVDEDILALKEQFRLSEAQKDALLQEVSGLKNKLEKLSLASDASLFHCPATIDSSKQSVECNNSQSEGESITTPCGRSKRNQKRNPPLPTPSESLHLVLDTTEGDGSYFLSPASVTTGSNKRVEKPQRTSRRIQSRRNVYDNSFENQESSWKPPKSAQDDEDDEVWEPPAQAGKQPKNTRKTRGRKTKSHVYNPHTDQENKSSLANKAVDSQTSDNGEDFKTPVQRRRRQLYNSAVEEPYECSPNLIELPPVQDSPHTVVRRQLRSKKKK